MTDSEQLKFNNLLKKLKTAAEKALQKDNFEKTLVAVSSAGLLLYDYNQVYTDECLEVILENLAEKISIRYSRELSNFKADSQTVLFYDGFGLDTRGVAIMYLNALVKAGYHVVYVTRREAIDTQPEIHKILENGNVDWQYISLKKSYLDWIDSLTKVIAKFTPKAMLFYTTPNDVSGFVAFKLFEGKIKRYLVDLTDHAFWLGTHCSDYFFGSREMSASNQYYGRKIPKSKLIKLGVNLLVSEEKDHSGLPFDVKSDPYVFSGGALYKTLGDSNEYYYKIVDHILSQHKGTKFLYAGSGDDHLLKRVISKFPGRAFHINERKDFYYLIQNCVIYLNTYPMFGGMMMKYSALAGKIPVTLRHNNDSDGLLLNQESTMIEYGTYEELISDVDHLINDSEYRKQREKLLEGSVITEQRFINNLSNAIENQKTDYQHEFIKLDTSTFQKEFLERFDFDKECYKIVNKMAIPLFNDFPWMYKIALTKGIRKLTKELRRKL